MILQIEGAKREKSRRSPKERHQKKDHWSRVKEEALEVTGAGTMKRTTWDVMLERGIPKRTGEEST